MLNFKVNLAKQFFFDRAAVKNAVDKATLRNHSKFGAFTRRNARDLLKYRKSPSRPGQPPTVHRTMSRKTSKGKVQSVSPLKEFIFFALDTGSRSVVIGPARLNKPGDAPHALEYGGASTVSVNGKTVSINVRARPYMRPSFLKAVRDLPDIWKNSIQR